MLQKLKPFFQGIHSESNNNAVCSSLLGATPPSHPRKRSPGPSLQLNFHKYQGAGNDFILVDNRDSRYDGLLSDTALVQRLCDRRFGIGADGLVQICRHPKYAFLMKYYNNDGEEGTLCGNGARCAVAFARQLGLLHFNEAHFMACDGPHYGLYDDVNDLVHIKMADVTDLVQYDDYNYLVHPGCRHHIVFIQQSLQDLDVVKEGRRIRYGEMYKDKNGANVNFAVAEPDGRLHIRTYERGVEDETWACGTGSVAAVIAYTARLHRGTAAGATPKQKTTASRPTDIGNRCPMTDCNIDPVVISHTHVKARGGELIVAMETKDAKIFTDIYLIGPASYVFSGTYTVHDPDTMSKVVATHDHKL